MDHNFLVIRLIKETFVVKPNILTCVPTFFFFFPPSFLAFNLDTFRVRGRWEKAVGAGWKWGVYPHPVSLATAGRETFLPMHRKASCRSGGKNTLAQ